ncbi:MAG TPA: hypothetical protein P5570_00720 [Candidatus Paceibacterota bacterium]|nr:hypothetical protein [Candidatus Paceibacterota bacterium]
MMQNISLFFHWYFIEIPKKIYRIWSNYLWFFKNYFSITELIKSFFSPWKRIYFEKKTKGIDLEEWFGNFIFNTFSRIIGIILRSFAIVIGIISELFAFVAGIVCFVLWLIFPFLLIFCLAQGINNIVKL